MTKPSPGPIAELWCRTTHLSLTWPSHDHYRFRTCGREYPVPWELGEKTSSQHNIERLPADKRRPGGKVIAQPVEVASSL